MTDTEIERIEALMRKATPGPWHARRNDQDDGRTHYDVDDSDEREVACVRHALPHNARLIVAAINALPALLAERKELLRRVEEAEHDAERERMRLAACGVAALGYFDGCHDDYKSASLSDVLALRTQLAEAVAVAAALPCPYCSGIGWYSDADPRNGDEVQVQCDCDGAKSEAARALLAQLAEAQAAQARTPAPHPYLRIDDTRCATCGRLKAVCEAEWAEHTKE